MAVILGFVAQYNFVVNVTRESSDSDVAKAYRKASTRAHPDKGGSVMGHQRLTARDANFVDNSAQLWAWSLDDAQCSPYHLFPLVIVLSSRLSSSVEFC